MSLETARLRYPVGTLALGADGYALRSRATLSDGCCPDPLCIPVCDTVCSFIDLLPSGPTWDYQKQQARQCSPVCGSGCLDDDCPSMAKYAAYAGEALHDMVQTILWPAIRESNPATAVTTQADWLDRFGWQDCYNSHCRVAYAGATSPYDEPGECGPVYIQPYFDEAFTCAMNHGVLMALVRAQRGGVKSLDWINFVIEPLGAILRPRRPWPEEVQAYLARAEPCEEEAEEGKPCFCDVATFEMCNLSGTLPACPSAVCGEEVGTVPAVQFMYRGDVEYQLYPAVLAAECIVRSLLTKKCPNIVYRCASVITEVPHEEPPLEG